MIKKLNEIHSGYCLNGNIINNLCYADDIALFLPSLGGLQLLISCCEEFANHNHITFNIDKSVILPIYFDISYHKPVKLYIDNKLLKVVKSYRYLGHLISEDLSDAIDIYIYIVILNSYINKAMQYHITLIIALRIQQLFYLKHLFLIYTLVAYGYQIDIAWLNLI